jgi:hypothetical protein
MCDYSLHHVANRPAQIEDKLVTTKFMNSIEEMVEIADDPCVWVEKIRPDGRSAP